MMKKTGTPVPLEKRPRGMHIVIEGMDGTGKSTLVQALGVALTERGVSHKLTREPTREGTFGKLINERRGARFRPLEEYWLFQLDRFEHWRNVVLPWIANGEVVIQDRFWHSTWVYQAPRLAEPYTMTEQIDREVMGDIFKAVGDDPLDYLEGWRTRIISESFQVTGDRYPDFVFILDLDPEVAYQRLSGGREKLDAFESLEKLTRYREDYLALSKFYEGRNHILDASRTTEQLVDDVYLKLLLPQQ